MNTRRVVWDEARLLEIERNSRHRKKKKTRTCGMFEKTDQPFQSRYLSNLDPPYHR
jgi:hypothetical protein